jgi:hypothetical protein
MNSHFRFAAALVITATATGIAACATAGTSSSPPTADSASTPFSRLASPAGQKKVGPYVWVWHTGKVGPHTMTVEADCPVKYVVVGGGSNSHGLFVGESKPNQAFDGWLVSIASYLRGYVDITVYAACAPVR